jgi:hypothetical protein
MSSSWTDFSRDIARQAERDYSGTAMIAPRGGAWCERLSALRWNRQLVIYFLAEVVPDFGLLRESFTRAARRQRLKELEAIVEENSAVGNLEELADQSFDEGQWARARELYDKLLKVSRPPSVDPFYRRGLSALA